MGSGGGLITTLVALGFTLAAPGCCGSSPALHEGNASAKIGFDLSQFTPDGLHGPPDGRRTLVYAFCVPDRSETLAEIVAIDTTLRVQRSGGGRLKCRAGEVRVMGHTRQPGFRDILLRLARFPWVRSIQEVHFE